MDTQPTYPRDRLMHRRSIVFTAIDLDAIGALETATGASRSEIVRACVTFCARHGYVELALAEDAQARNGDAPYPDDLR